ncbi:putative hydrolase of the HAD superfamily [Dysgonomonas sp. PFB1-18]|uniref:HAD family hydrolase n=1 Tax=unclassified Dysgonomonas TaxID=2630389 RepID=UPI0024741410|nr:MULTISPECIES: HAD family hydrolase [unclassified Dysgonomonas]MDH6310250.1 putative hydrolase of the HAD superfamily [Dysgonomonas sp. PF1-14]MDH6340068.1 putative hydrolase of the HAD superfamily [Dysgonomonas sp. PF1-16]MDH6381825.1 putative hydrolase of the HAD superfamily [Dysgonomonas sp. PFB1-18]MDH6398933.1 putative hydrolase of the HAD superfamily [Dysgonomonas sp. PF1-23]
MNIEIIAFDADDTLWDNEPLFQSIEKELCTMLTEYGDMEHISSTLFDIEMNNLELYGYGAKAFTLSMIETALRVSGNKISADKIALIIEKGKYLLNMPIQLLHGVEEALSSFSKKYKLVVATKGDLLDQERKLVRSGLAKYFDHVEIMPDKTEKEYRKLVSALNTQPENILMVGNSLKSDIYPPLSIGMYAAYVPYHTMWKHEVADENIVNDKFYKVESLSSLSSLIIR